MNKDELYNFEDFIETPRAISSPVKINVILEQRIKTFLETRKHRIGRRLHGPHRTN